MQHLMKKSLIAVGISFAVSTASLAATWEVTVTNLTYGNYFTPIIMTAHADDVSYFKAGEAATTAMEHVAECGHTAAFITSTGPNGSGGVADDDTKVTAAPLAPGSSVTQTLTVDLTATPAPKNLTVVSMVLPTNDAFLGLAGATIKAAAGTYTYFVNAYDAGTENNDEKLNPGTCTIGEVGLIPAAPGGDAGTGGTGVEIAATGDAKGTIHIHRGILGDDNKTGGKSDLVSSIHRWQNPVAKITVKVTP